MTDTFCDSVLSPDDPLEAEIEMLHEQLSILKGATAALCALMELDMQSGKVTPTGLRKALLQDARELSA